MVLCLRCNETFLNQVLYDEHYLKCFRSTFIEFANGLVELSPNDEGYYHCKCDNPNCVQIYESLGELEDHVTPSAKWMDPEQVSTMLLSSPTAEDGHKSLSVSPNEANNHRTAHPGEVTNSPQLEANLPRSNSSHKSQSYTVLGSSLQDITFLRKLGLLFQSQTKAICCANCGVLLLSHTALNHVRRKHHDIGHKSDYEGFDEEAKRLGVITEFPQFNTTIPAISGIPIYTNALMCEVKGCGQIFYTLSSMKKHHQTTAIPGHFKRPKNPPLYT